MVVASRVVLEPEQEQEILLILLIMQFVILKIVSIFFWKVA